MEEGQKKARRDKHPRRQKVVYRPDGSGVAGVARVSGVRRKTDCESAHQGRDGVATFGSAPATANNSGPKDGSFSTGGLAFPVDPSVQGHVFAGRHFPTYPSLSPPAVSPAARRRTKFSSASLLGRRALPHVATFAPWISAASELNNVLISSKSERSWTLLAFDASDTNRGDQDGDATGLTRNA
uniref:Uncharacterized protein n=1 Tax=Steinernema glaseri TaxID=37863 RepID=A0A1I7YHD4_9BILA